MHGKYDGFKWKPGGGTVGRTDVMVSLLAVIAERYPGIRSEDTHLTILAKYAGFIGGIFMDVVSTNRSPSLTELTTDNPPKKAWMAQIYRWSAGSHALEVNYGEHHVISIASDTFPWFTVTDPIGFLKSLKGIKKMNLQIIVKNLVTAFFASIKIRKKALEKPDILQGPGAKASW